MLQLYSEMNREFHERFEIFQKVSNHNKSELLKAHNMIKKYTSILKENIDIINSDQKGRIVVEFIEK